MIRVILLVARLMIRVILLVARLMIREILLIRGQLCGLKEFPDTLLSGYPNTQNVIRNMPIRKM